jgi:hypothetical protein
MRTSYRADRRSPTGRPGLCSCYGAHSAARFGQYHWAGLGDGPQEALAVQEGGGPQFPGQTAGGVGRWRIGPILFYPIGLLLSIVQ